MRLKKRGPRLPFWPGARFGQASHAL